MNHRIARLLFGFGVGLIVAVLAFKWITNPAPRTERKLEETIVLAARLNLQAALSLQDVEVVDPLAPNRKIGKSYVYRAGDGWEVSGYYRRGQSDRWHPFLMSLDESRKLVHIKVRDGGLVERATTDPLLEAVP